MKESFNSLRHSPHIDPFVMKRSLNGVEKFVEARGLYSFEDQIMNSMVSTGGTRSRIRSPCVRETVPQDWM